MGVPRLRVQRDSRLNIKQFNIELALKEISLLLPDYLSNIDPNLQEYPVQTYAESAQQACARFGHPDIKD